MKTSKNKSIITACIALVVALLTVVGCDSQTSVTDSLNVGQNNIGAVNFNPQPEPPAKVYEFEMVGDPSGDWSGRFPGFREGTIQIQTMSSMMRGKTIHVVQTWMIVPPEPIFPPEPIVPPEPVHISLKGILNLASGKVVLNGMSDELGVNVHVRGQLTTLESGDISIGGELMFNPQPEPPPSPARGR